jgi:hypothetical protein
VATVAEKAAVVKSQVLLPLRARSPLQVPRVVLGIVRENSLRHGRMLLVIAQSETT